MPSQKRTAKRSASNRPKRRRLSYPLIIFMILATGVLLAGYTLKTLAVTLHVTAKVSAPFVTDPATISSPANGARFSSVPVNVQGSCPANAGYVEIFRNSTMSGSAICDINSTFQLQIDLFPGQNDLVAHVFNITDDEGPISNTVTVYYDVPIPPATTTPQTPATATTPKAPFLLTTAFIYKGFFVGQKVEWPLEIVGGNSPYAINVDWGDGNNSVISRKDSGSFTISHVYKKPGNGYKGHYQVSAKASDVDGQSASIGFFVIVNPPNTVTTGNIFNKPTPHLGFKLNWLLIAWPSYVIVSLMIISFFLGERQELLILNRRHLIRR